MAFSIRKAIDDKLLGQAASLAFLTVVALVPLLAAFSHFGARFFEKQPELITLLAQILPYTEERITEILRQFLDQSGSLTGVGFGTFLVTALLAFDSVESVINRIWDVPKGRSIKSRISSFALLLFSGPLLIAAVYSARFYLEQDPTWRHLTDSSLAQGLPFLISWMALTILNWQVPNTKVYFENALFGGVISALLLELLRFGFHVYVEHAPQISIVYGSFGLALFFMISIHAAWAIVLLGTEIAYCTQNFDLLTRSHERHISHGAWLGLAAMVLMVWRFRQGQPHTEHAVLARQLNLPSSDLRSLLMPLAEAGLLHEDPDDDGGWMLGGDPHELSVRAVFSCYEGEGEELSESDLPAEIEERLVGLRERLLESQNQAFAGLVLTDLLPVSGRGKNQQGVA